MLSILDIDNAGTTALKKAKIGTIRRLSSSRMDTYASLIANNPSTFYPADADAVQLFQKWYTIWWSKTKDHSMVNLMDCFTEEEWGRFCAFHVEIWDRFCTYQLSGNVDIDTTPVPRCEKHTAENHTAIDQMNISGSHRLISHDHHIDASPRDEGGNSGNMEASSEVEDDSSSEASK